MGIITNKPKIIRHQLKDDGIFPNSILFLIIYKSVFDLSEQGAAEEIEDTFSKNQWTNSWRNGIYDYAHYHSITHEVLGVYSGSASVQFGGPGGIKEEISKGDVVIIPAGVAHQCISASKDFKCVGAYPNGKEYDIRKGEPADRPEADKNISNVPLPDTDPVYGTDGPLMLQWEIW